MRSEGAARLPSVLVVGFPKSGTSTLNRALRASGLRTAHWRWKNRPIGKLIYDGWYDRGDPFAFFKGLDAITQMDYCRPEDMLNFWPNLDIALLLAIREMYPGCRFILNHRPAGETASSMDRWHRLTARLAWSDIVGLPVSRGTSTEERSRWIETHHRALRKVFADDPLFLDLDITASDARDRLAAFLGIEIRWWGVANANLDPDTEGDAEAGGEAVEDAEADMGVGGATR